MAGIYGIRCARNHFLSALLANDCNSIELLELPAKCVAGSALTSYKMGAQSHRFSAEIIRYDCSKLV